MKTTKTRKSRAAEFNSFVTENETRLVSLAYRLTRNMDDARDLTQDAFLRGWERIDQFKPGTNLGGWMYTIIRNSWIDACRRNSQRATSAPMLESRAQGDASPDRAELCLVLRDVLRLLENLPRAQRQAVMMKSAGKTYREAAKSARVPMGTMQVRIFKARATLAAAL